MIIYDKLIPGMGNTVKTLPALFLNSKLITGNSAIRQQLISGIKKPNVVEKTPSDGHCDLEDYWNKEMHSGVDNEADEADDLMDAVKRRALDQSLHHKKNGGRKEKRRETILSSTRQDNIQLDNVKGDKISEMVGNDPMMQKFWENQESTPGF